jgi:hypothetical protein
MREEIEEILNDVGTAVGKEVVEIFASALLQAID